MNKFYFYDRLKGKESPLFSCTSEDIDEAYDDFHVFSKDAFVGTGRILVLIESVKEVVASNGHGGSSEK